MLADPMSPDAVTQEVNVVPMNFRVDHVPVPGKPGEFKEVHKVDLVKKGSNGESTPWRIKELQGVGILWQAIGPYYERWLEGQEDPADGTPIDCLPFIPKGVVDHLRMLHIRSAEDLAGATDADLERIGMGARGWREKTRVYLDAKAGGAVAETNTMLKAENERMAKELEELKAQVNALSAMERKEVQPSHNDLVEIDPKRKRGRPRKNPQ